MGDAQFKKKSEAKIQSMFDKGVTVLFVSHSLEQVKRICDKAVMLEHGNVIAYGDVEQVATVYNAKLAVNKRRNRRRKKKLEKELEEQAKRSKER